MPIARGYFFKSSRIDKEGLCHQELPMKFKVEDVQV
jgi:hypothetical protein